MLLGVLFNLWVNVFLFLLCCCCSCCSLYILYRAYTFSGSSSQFVLNCDNGDLVFLNLGLESKCVLDHLENCWPLRLYYTRI